LVPQRILRVHRSSPRNGALVPLARQPALLLAYGRSRFRLPDGTGPARQAGPTQVGHHRRLPMLTSTAPRKHDSALVPFVSVDELAPRLPLLITGITGGAGYNALGYFKERYPGQVIGIRPRQTWQLIGDGIIPLDIEDDSGLGELFHLYRFR